MLHDSSNYTTSSNNRSTLSNNSSMREVEHRRRNSIDRILSAAIEEQKHRRSNEFLAYNHNSLLDNSYDDEDGDNEYHIHPGSSNNNNNNKSRLSRFDQYIDKLERQRNQRMEEEHKRLCEEMNEREMRRQRKLEESKCRKDLALAIIQRRRMKQPQPSSLKLVDLSNVSVEYKPTLSFDGSVRTSSIITISPTSSSTSNTANYSYDEEGNEENQCDIMSNCYQDDSFDVEIESSVNFDEEDEDYNEWDELEIMQAHAFDEEDYIAASHQEEDEVLSPMYRNDENIFSGNNGDGQSFRCTKSLDMPKFQNSSGSRFVTVSNYYSY